MQLWDGPSRSDSVQLGIFLGLQGSYGLYHNWADWTVGFVWAAAVGAHERRIGWAVHELVSAGTSATYSGPVTFAGPMSDCLASIALRGPRRCCGLTGLTVESYEGGDNTLLNTFLCCFGVLDKDSQKSGGLVVTAADDALDSGNAGNIIGFQHGLEVFSLDTQIYIPDHECGRSGSGHIHLVRSVPGIKRSGSWKPTGHGLPLEQGDLQLVMEKVLVVLLRGRYH